VSANIICYPQVDPTILQIYLKLLPCFPLRGKDVEW